jgi:hypothetical protein
MQDFKPALARRPGAGGGHPFSLRVPAAVLEDSAEPLAHSRRLGPGSSYKSIDPHVMASQEFYEAVTSGRRAELNVSVPALERLKDCDL